MPILVNKLTPTTFSSRISGESKIENNKEYNANRSAVLWSTLSALAAAGAIVAGVSLVKGRTTALHNLFDAKKLSIEKGTGLLKDVNGTPVSDIFEYNTKAGKYLRKYKDGTLILSGKNIDKDGKPLSDNIDYYAVRYNIQDGKLKEITSERRNKGRIIQNAKDILTIDEKKKIIEAKIEALSRELVENQRKIIKIRLELTLLNKKYKRVQDEINKIIKDKKPSDKVEYSDELKGYLLEVKNIVNEIKKYSNDYNLKLNDIKAIAKSLKEQRLVLDKLNKKTGTV